MSDLINFTMIYSIYNSNNLGNDINIIMKKNISNNEKLKETKILINNTQNQLLKLKKRIIESTKLLSKPTAIKLSNKIDDIIDSLGAINLDIESMLIKITQDNVLSVDNNIKWYNKSINDLDHMLYSTLEKYQENLYYAVQSGAVKLDDLDKLTNIEGLSLEHLVAIKNVKKKLELETEIINKAMSNLAEPTAIEDKKGNVSENAKDSVSKEQVDNSNSNIKVNNSLKERLNKIVYNSDSFYGADVEGARIEYELEQLIKQIYELKNKEKLSFKDTITLQSLITQYGTLNEMLENIKLSHRDVKREEKLANVDAKISNKKEDILKEQERKNTAHSKFFKYRSAKKEKKLTEQLQELQSKMGIIQSKQRQSVLLKFDKKNNKIQRKAKRSATRKFIFKTTKNKLNKLKKFAKNTIQETKNITYDLKQRFVSKPDMINELRNENIFLGDTPIEIVTSNENNMSMQM